MAPNRAAPSEPHTAGLKQLSRAVGYLRAHKIAAGLTVLAAVAVIGIGIALTLFFAVPGAKRGQYLVPRALARLDAGELDQARQLASEVHHGPGSSPAERGAALYVLGAALSREAHDQSNAFRRRTLYLLAARYLEDAQTLGFPPDREADGLLALGRAQHYSGRHAQALAPLREALDRNPHAAAEIHRLLAASYSALEPPKTVAALEHARALLAIQDLAVIERHGGLLLLARLELQAGNLAAVRDLLAQIPEKSPRAADAILLSAKATIEDARAQMATPAEAPHAHTALTVAIGRLRQLEARPGIDRELIPQAQLLTAQCYEALGDRRAATAQYERLRRSRFGRPEGLAAALFLAELHRQDGRPAPAVEMYKLAVSQAGPREFFDNSLLPLKALESRLAAAAAEFTSQGHFAEAVELTKAMLPVVSEGLALRHQIAAEQAWAEQLLSLAGTQPALQAQTTRAEAREHFRAAGANGQRLAMSSIASRTYVADLATAAENYQRGHGYRQAARVWGAFLRQNPRERRAEAMVGLGESLLALGDTDAALAALQSCRDEFPSHPAVYRGRILESAAWQEKGDLLRARDLLQDNLYRHALTPKSSEWRDSLFALGQVLYRQAGEEETQSRLSGVNQADPEAIKEGLKLLEQSYETYQESVRMLAEAVQRYPAAPQALLARYSIAEAHRHSALAPRRKLSITSIEISRLALTRQIAQDLEAAIDEYQRLMTDLSDEQTLPRRTAVELAVLRNCYFGRADALFDLNRFEEAIQAYSAATNRYQNEPESLEAYVQIATCYRRLKRPNEARGTLEQARVVLGRIRPDADFLRTTRLDRRQWDDLLGWLRTL